MEYTSPHTPQQNGVVERAFATLKQRAVASMTAAKFCEGGRKLLWPEAISHTTQLSNVLFNSVKPRPPDEMFFGAPSKAYGYLQPFGRVGYMTDPAAIKGKLRDRSFKCVYLGWGEDTASGTYRMYNPVTRRVILTRHVYKWADWHGVTSPMDRIGVIEQAMEKKDQASENRLGAVGGKSHFSRRAGGDATHQSTELGKE
jgi:hypothetical protein